jgi:hypothetical protein
MGHYLPVLWHVARPHSCSQLSSAPVAQFHHSEYLTVLLEVIAVLLGLSAVDRLAAYPAAPSLHVVLEVGLLYHWS